MGGSRRPAAAPRHGAHRRCCAGQCPFFGPLSPRKVRRALETLPIFLDYLAENETFLNRETTALLSAAGIELPCAEEYLDRVLDYYLAHREDVRD